MKFILILGIFTFLVGDVGYGARVWTPDETSLYRQRRFIALEQDLAGRGDAELGRFLQLQQADLGGCRALHRGVGGVASLARCSRFFDRERKFGLTSSGRDKLVHDINVLCPRLLADRKSVETLLNVGGAGVVSGRSWKPCLSAAWKQVYLTVYANFEADPVGMLAFFRRAQGGLPSDSLWKNKIGRLFAAP